MVWETAGRENGISSLVSGLSSHSQGPSSILSTSLWLVLLLLCSLSYSISLPKGEGAYSMWHQVGQEAYDALSPGPVALKYCLDFWYFAVCSYCSTDLYSLWSAVGCFAEASIRLFAAELVLVLCK